MQISKTKLGLYLICASIIGIFLEGVFWFTTDLKIYASNPQILQVFIPSVAAIATALIAYKGVMKTIKFNLDKHETELRNKLLETCSIAIGKIATDCQTFNGLQTTESIEKKVSVLRSGLYDEGIEALGHFNLESISILSPGTIGSIRRANIWAITFKKNIQKLDEERINFDALTNVSVQTRKLLFTACFKVINEYQAAKNLPLDEFDSEQINTIDLDELLDTYRNY